MSRSTRIPAALVALSLAIAACDNAGSDRILDVQAGGVIGGAVFFDANGTRLFESADDRAADGVQVALVRIGTSDTVARTTTGTNGGFSFRDIAVGEYRVVVPAATLADSLVLVYQDPPGRAVEDDPATPAEATVVLGADDTLSVEIGVGFPSYTIEEARALPADRKVVVSGVAITQINALGDTSLYLQGDSLAIRLTRVTANVGVFPGDSLNVSGTTASRAGQPVLALAQPYVLSTTLEPAPASLDAATAADADNGRYDASLVTVTDLTVVDTATTGGRFRIDANDGSADLTVVILPNGSYTIPAYGPGAVLTVTGVLVPDAAGTFWVLEPRSGTDVTVTTAAPAVRESGGRAAS